MDYSRLQQGLPCLFDDTITIQLIRQSDLAEIIDMLSNPKVYQYLFFAPAPTEVYEGFFAPIIENTRDAIAREQWPEHPTFILRDQNNQFMGMLGITRVMMLTGNFEVGYQLPEHAWRRGIATRGCQLMTQIAFEQLAAHKVCADCYGNNIGSARVLIKNGFTEEGRQVGYYQVGQGFDDRVLFGMTRAQFAARQGA
ncbi:GNAT family N-acetyltransferase [Photobacterium atrarenae]|uniref:GNAT family N-acetyltransferase n=1 Tax=Photobacterium atrarenae TaxID=865757 RepID=A0ABY5GPT2_9GAMM|nr:GNAT family protein [Photobacterium atrarenae]UTV30669.1 GNAT family N-acetyltransferase [Photobacterium atrarenae]